MNNLSWLLYWADVAPKLGSSLANLVPLSSFVALIWGAFMVISSILDCGLEKEEQVWATARKKMAFVPWLLSVLFMIGILVPPFLPSKDTIYAIAASEVAEEIVFSERVQNTTNKAFQAVDAWLDKQIEKGESNERD